MRPVLSWIEVLRRAGESSPPPTANALQRSQIMANVLQNAVKFSDSGDSVGVTIECRGGGRTRMVGASRH